MMTERTFKKYKLLIDEWFVNGFNGAKSYQKYYPKSKSATASSNFEKILRITEVQEYKSKKEEDAKKSLRTTHDVLLEELQNWAYSDITQTISLTPKQVKGLPEKIRRLITKYKHTTKRMGSDDGLVIEDMIELHFVSKEKAMEMIHKHEVGS